jgi:hypothetical protein
MIYKLEIKLCYKTPNKVAWSSEEYRYFCEVVWQGGRYTVEINKFQYDYYQADLATKLDFLVTNNWFIGPKLYCLNMF